MRVKSAAPFVAFLLLLLLCGACGNVGPVVPSSTARPARIISLTPSTTEILYGVGAFDRVVAVSDYCSYPPEVNKLPRVGGWNNPNMEQIASLRPDLVVFSDAQAQFVKDKVEAAGIKTLAVPSQTLEDAYKSIELVGRATGEEEAARKLLEQTRASVESVRLSTERLPKRRVLCVVDRVPGTRSTTQSTRRLGRRSVVSRTVSTLARVCSRSLRAASSSPAAWPTSSMDL